MNIKLFVAVVISLFLLQFMNIAVSEEFNNEKTDTFIESCYKSAESLDLFGFDKKNKNCRLEVYEKRYDEDQSKSVIDIRSTEFHGKIEGLDYPLHTWFYEFELDEKTSEIVLVLNNYARLLSNSNMKIANSNISKEEIIKKAKLYISKLNPSIKNMELDYCYSNFKNKPKNGLLEISFNRIYKGYEYSNDFINITLSNKYGLISYYKKYSSKECSVEVKINKERALEKAKMELRKVFDTLSHGHQIQYLDEEIKGVNLLIINPSMYPVLSDTSKKMKKNDAVLVYNFMFSINYKFNLGKDIQKKGSPIIMWIFIDAATGEFVCANYEETN